ncbi:MAG TPA: hypothetical protein ENJ88_11160 [Phaeodactylibacter sp.]|nr:hypothetical protein [Phaeodactylibacter sp.]
MKKTFFLLAFLVCALSAQSQVWVELSARAMYGARGFYNQNIIDDRNHNYFLTTNEAFGGGLGMNFGTQHGLQLEFMWAGNRQNFDYDDGNGTLLENRIKWFTREVVLLYRFYAGASYIEIGPKLVKVLDLKQRLNGGILSQRPEIYYQQTYPAAVFGVGGLIAGSEDFSFRMGVRLEYSWADFISEKGKEANFPATYVNPPYETYTPSHPFSASVFAELNIPIGGVAKAGCGQRTFIWGGY